jgi:ABC-type lipoprotein release transport system permease subunit
MLLLSRLPFPVVLALRYFRSTRRDAFTTFLSVVAVAAITTGVGALILALSALSGFQDLLRGEVLSQTPDVEVELPPGLPPGGADEVAEAIRGVPGVLEVRPVIRGEGEWASPDASPAGVTPGGAADAQLVRRGAGAWDRAACGESVGARARASVRRGVVRPRSVHDVPHARR